MVKQKKLLDKGDDDEKVKDETDQVEEVEAEEIIEDQQDQVKKINKYQYVM